MSFISVVGITPPTWPVVESRADVAKIPELV
jgi:hypothetical protein